MAKTMMFFPETVEEFMEQYKIVDTEQVYTNGAELVPIFRMKQWFDYIEGVNKMRDDTISRQAAIDALGDEPEVWSGKDEYEQGLNNQWHYDVNALKAVPSAERHGRWIPVKMRPMDSEEREYWEDQIGEELADEDAVMFDCPMPEDGQDILVSYRKWISTDKCEIDGGCYGLEENGDWEGVIAWMPLPEPYKEGEQE